MGLRRERAPPPHTACVRARQVDVAIEWPELGIKVDSLLGDGMQALPASQLLQHDQAPLMRLVQERVARRALAPRHLLTRPRLLRTS